MMKPKSYKILCLCLENSILGGVRKAFKYSDTPSEEDIAGMVEQYVMNEICEYFDFDEEEYE